MKWQVMGCKQNSYLFQICVADMNMGIVVLFPVYPLLTDPWISGSHACSLILSMRFFSLAFTMIMWYQRGRYVAVLYPSRHVTLLPPGRT